MKIFDAAYHAKKDIGIDSRDIGYLRCWANLADIMSCRYRATGEVKNFNAAIDASSRAVDIAETYDPQNDLPGMLNNLAMSLNLRIKRTGHTDDMRLAIDSLQRALQLWPPGDPRRMQTVLNLISFQHTQGWKLLDEDSLQGAVQHFREALPIGEENIGVNPSMDVHFMTQSVSFVHGVNFAHSTYPDRIWSKEVEEMARLYAKPNSVHPLAGVSYKILRRCHLSRWTETHDIEDIDAAIDIARCMIVRAEGRPGELVIAWSDLGDCLYERYKIREDVKNCEEAVAVLLKGVRLPASIPFLRMKAGQKAVRILSELKDWVRASEVSQEIIDLLVILNGRSLDWQDKQYWLREFSYEAPFYASIALQAGSSVCKVIDMLETCRGSILGHVIDDRTDLSDLTKAAPEKAERFRALRDEINAVIDPSQNMNSRVELITRRNQADAEMRACLADIRNLEDFHQFLLGPTEKELRAVAAQGPIIIVNISWIRSDAIIITKDDSVLLSLPELKYRKARDYIEKDLSNFSLSDEDIGKNNETYRELQKWLWDSCVKLIFEKLDDLVGGPEKVHIWWIGIGIANSLPFHAAGKYTGKVASETSLSRAISSYTPTLKILIHGRRRLRKDRPKSDWQGLTKLAIIIMPTTPGESELEGVVKEAEAVCSIVSGTFYPDIISQPSAKDTKAIMRECEIMHFACHGESIVLDPSSSHLLLQTESTIPDSEPLIDKLKVRDVAAADLSGTLAFLSACSTAENKFTRLWDEVLHLASGFQVAGFSHVIGNLWPADDDVSVELVKAFYQHLKDAGTLGDGENVAKALNEALIYVARKEAKRPLTWAQYVHFGV